jgi:hypothetical protein
MPSNYEAKPISIKTYIKGKIRMLTKDFYMRLTDEEVTHMKSLKREIDVDNYVHDLFQKKL